MTHVEPPALTDPVRAAFAAAGTRREFRTGAVLFHEGDPSEHVLPILAGRVKIVASGNAAELTLAVPARAPGSRRCSTASSYVV